MKRRKRVRLGIDGMSLVHLNITHVHTIYRQIQTDTFTLNVPRYVNKAKRSGGYRQIGVPTLTDSIYLSTANEVIQEAIEPILLDCVHGYRPKRGVDTAWKRVGNILPYIHAVALVDINNAYDNVNLDTLRYIVHKQLPFPMILNIIDTVIKHPTTIKTRHAGTRLNPTIEYRRCGLVQGYATSPALFNLYMHEVDECMTAITDGSHAYTRYADNILLVDGSIEQLSGVVNNLIRYCQGLGFSLDVSMSEVKAGDKLNWLGRTYTFT